MAKHAERRKTSRSVEIFDVKISSFSIRSSLKHARKYSVVWSLAILISTSVIGSLLYFTGVFRDSSELVGFGWGILGLDFKFSWWMLAPVIFGVFVINYTVFSLAALFNVWLFNTALALSGGLLLKIEKVSK